MAKQTQENNQSNENIGDTSPKDMKVEQAPTLKPSLEPTREPISSVDSFSLADMPIAPLTMQTSHLANTSQRVEWEQIVNGRKRKFYIEVSYGNVAPNADTETLLNILIHLANQAETFKEVPVSKYQTNMLQGHGTKGGDRGKRIHRHLEAIYGMSIKTNFVWDRKKKKYKSVETRVLSGITYESDEIGEKKIVTRELKDGTLQTFESDKLESVTFAPDFVDNFLNDLIPIDLDVYFKIKNPTPKKLYKITNKFINTTQKDFGLDLIHFCKTRLGMKSEYLDDPTKTSRIASKLRPDLKRVNEFYPGDYDPITLTKDSSQPSGYKIVFSNINDSGQAQMFNYIESFTSAEKDAFIQLKKENVWTNVAYKLVMELNRTLGKEGIEYIHYTLRRFKAYEQSNKIQVPPVKRPAVLMDAFKQNWYFSAFKEWHSKKQKEQEKEELKRYGHGTLNIFDNNEKVESKEPQPILQGFGGFNLEGFKSTYPEHYNHIYQTIYSSYERLQKEHQAKIDFKMAFGNTIQTFCEESYAEFQKGNKDYKPDLSVYT